MTELIFMEGVSGIGKTTMLRMLADELTAAGYRVRAFLEFDYTNPIDFYCTAYLTADEHRNLCEAFPDEHDTLIQNTVPAGEIRLANGVRRPHLVLVLSLILPKIGSKNKLKRLSAPIIKPRKLLERPKVFSRSSGTT